MDNTWFEVTKVVKKLQRAILHEMRLLSNFSVSGCLFECNLLVAYQICECVPWMFPMFNATHESTCKNSERYKIRIRMLDCLLQGGSTVDTKTTLPSCAIWRATAVSPVTSTNPRPTRFTFRTGIPAGFAPNTLNVTKFSMSTVTQLQGLIKRERGVVCFQFSTRYHLFCPHEPDFKQKIPQTLRNLGSLTTVFHLAKCTMMGFTTSLLPTSFSILRMCQVTRSSSPNASKPLKRLLS